MKKFTPTLLAILFISLSVKSQNAFALKDPVITIDFGAGNNVPEFNLSKPAVYDRVNKSCPDDGYYTYTENTGGCFNNDWFTLGSDHTGGGNMMLVNANPAGGVFFSSALKGLKPNTTYQFAVYLMNVCRINGGCSPLPPQIAISIATFNGVKIAGFKTGQLSQRSSPYWKKYSGFFTIPSGETDLILTMSNLTQGNCGNDFAMDDITICEREELKEEPKKSIQKEPGTSKTAKTSLQPIAHVAISVKPPVTEIQKSQSIESITETDFKTVKKSNGQLVTTSKPAEKPMISSPVISLQSFVPVPPMISQRANPVVKTIVTTAGEMTIDLYDNGQVDGDTVTIYHNNELVVEEAALGTQAISLKITVDEKQPHHEIVMVANNLGSIPPNTSLMIVTINGRRYDLFISSSEEKNAKVVIDLVQ